LSEQGELLLPRGNINSQERDGRSFGLGEWVEIAGVDFAAMFGHLSQCCEAYARRCTWNLWLD
jgi:hypothetical protein